MADVGYRDQDRLKIAAFWKPKLVQALQESRVLVAVISPHYLNSGYCGREVGFFRQRFERLIEEGGQQQQEHRIIPVFWIDHAQCTKDMPEHVKRFFDELQNRQSNMAAEYPVIGLHNFYDLGKISERNAVLNQLAKRICELSNLKPLPELNAGNGLEDFPPFFEGKAGNVTSVIATGPSGTNVVYAVPTLHEAEDQESLTPNLYAERREDCRPFVDALGATVELATREGLNGSGQNDGQYRSLGFPDDLIDKIRQAKRVNSPVLIVLDLASLCIPTIKTQLSVYDETDFLHVGLVTAAGTDLEASRAADILPTKYQGHRPNHLWTVPSTRNVYVQGVVDVISSLKKVLQQTGETAVAMPGSPMPGISSTLANNT